MPGVTRMEQRGTTRAMSEDRKALPPARALWARVEQEKLARGWNDSELARAAGVDRKTHGRLRTNVRKPLPETVVAFATTLDIPLDEAYQLAGMDPQLALARSIAAVVEEAAAGESEKPAEDELSIESTRLEEMLARIPIRKRRWLEEMHIEQRQRYERQLEEARADYSRMIDRIKEQAEREIGRDRQPSDDDDKESDSSAIKDISMP